MYSGQACGVIWEYCKNKNPLHIGDIPWRTAETYSSRGLGGAQPRIDIIPIPSQNIPKTHRWRQFTIICGVGSMILQTLGPITFVLINTIPTQSQHPDISVIVLQTWPDHGLQMWKGRGVGHSVVV